MVAQRIGVPTQKGWLLARLLSLLAGEKEGRIPEICVGRILKLGDFQLRGSASLSPLSSSSSATQR